MYGVLVAGCLSIPRSSAQRLLHACRSHDKGVLTTALYVRLPRGFFTHAAAATKGYRSQRVTFVSPKASSRMQLVRQKENGHSASRSSAQRLLRARSSRDKGISTTALRVRPPKGFFTHAAAVTKGIFTTTLHVRLPRGFFTHAAAATKGYRSQRVTFVSPKASSRMQLV
jgi:hypothetical protein